MKIAFLCGSLEPGRDGVGDYVRRLALELLRQGHQTAAIALNDQHIVQEHAPASAQPSFELPELRLPASWSVRRRFQRAEQWLAGFQPTWISLQFVPYAFQAKGLPLGLAQHLRKIVQGRKLHVMMHEGWVGAESDLGIKRWLLRHLQKLTIRYIIVRLQPLVIHTHLPIYRTRLQQLGFEVSPLPIFSNIPVFPTSATSLDNVLFRVGVFSNADASDSFISFLRNLVQDLVSHSHTCQVLLMGGEPKKMQALMASLENVTGLEGNIHYTGFLSPVQLSAAMQSCHLGLTPVPRSGLGKSGSVAAFLAHGIPVAAPNVLPDSSESDIGFFSASLRSTVLLQPDISCFEQASISAQAARDVIDVSVIACAFSSDLAKHSS